MFYYLFFCDYSVSMEDIQKFLKIDIGIFAIFRVRVDSPGLTDTLREPWFYFFPISSIW